MYKLILKDFLIFKDFRNFRRENPSVAGSILDRFSYKNPTYVSNEKFGYSNFGVDEYIRTYKEFGNDCFFYRGTYKKLWRMLQNFGIRFSTDREYQKGLEIPKYPLQIKLRENQEKFVNTFVECKEGIMLCPTSYGKTVSALGAICRIGRRAVVIVHTTDLQKQWIKECVEVMKIPKKDLGGCGGIFSKPIIGHINICLYHTLSKQNVLKQYVKGTGIVISEECQKTAINSFSDCVNFFDAEYRIGMSASHKRKDGKEFITEDALGEVIFKGKIEGKSSKILSHINIIHSEYFDFEYDWDKNHTELVNRISRDKDRNLLILKRCYEKVKLGSQVMIVVERKEQAFILQGALDKKGVKVAVLAGNVTPKDREKFDSNLAKKYSENYKDKTAYEEIKKLAENKKLDVIIGTQKVEVGISIRTLNHLIVSSLVSSNIEDRLNQIVGRVERTHGDSLEKKHGVKTTPTVDIIMDSKFKHIRRNIKDVKSFFTGRIKELNARPK